MKGKEITTRGEPVKHKNFPLLGKMCMKNSYIQYFGKRISRLKTQFQHLSSNVGNMAELFFAALYVVIFIHTMSYAKFSKPKVENEPMQRNYF